MVAKRKKKYESGEGAQFVTRKWALKRLQLSLKDFRRLCILKGIYPREPNKRKVAQKGKTGIKTLYHKKDIQFLMHEPIIWKFRDLKAYYRKISRAKGMQEFGKMKYYINRHPTLNLDHIVKERYPTFIDALNDLDDCLTLCFMFSTFPSLSHVPKNQSSLCRRLTIEFLHAVIQAKALRKVFVSIKGYYYQVEIQGQTVTWIVPHHFSFEPQDREEVDFRIMSTFIQFYTIMLGFVNFHLYHSLNLVYPPKLDGYGINSEEKNLVDEEIFVSERIAALNIPLAKIGMNPEIEDNDEIDQFPSAEDLALEAKKEEMKKVRNLKKLFHGLKFFINREVPREPMVFIIRCFGGFVSWDKQLFVGASFEENDETITHQIVDRPNIKMQFLSRYYVQPQWVFDSVNACELLPVEKYFIGATLPPHLSPFTNTGKDQVYIPPEIRNPEKLVENEDDDDEEGNDSEETNTANKEDVKVEEVKIDVDVDPTDAETIRMKKKQKMVVKVGEVHKEDEFAEQRQAKQEYHLREKMIHKKHRKLYRSMMEGRKSRLKEIWLLRKKRKLHDEEEKANRKAAKKPAAVQE